MRFSKPVFAACCDAAAQVLKLERPADAALSAFFREHPQLGQQDRALVAETVFGILRRRRLLEYLIGTRRMRELVLACWTVVLGANVREVEALAGEQLGAALARAKQKAREPLPLPIECDLPDWLLERLVAQLGEAQTRRLAASLLVPAPLDLRVNVLKTTREDVLAKLAASGIAAQATPLAPAGVRLADKPSIQRHPLFLEGAIEVQDEGSQLLCALVGAKRGEMVADFCAGAGGKTLALGMMMRSAGRLYAFDVSERRLARLRPRVARSGLSNVHVQRIESEKDVRLSRLARKLDRVLVDAPCSGLGTLRRNPDLKWRQTPESIVEMTAKQASILRAAAGLVKPGGRLVYATCSLLREENDAIVEAFLASHGDFTRQSAAQALAEQRIALDTGIDLELRPDVHGTDGFFAALLERKR